jgi:hypothetical protein
MALGTGRAFLDFYGGFALFGRGHSPAFNDHRSAPFDASSVKAPVEISSTMCQEIFLVTLYIVSKKMQGLSGKK